jgi:hypothetical protein
MKKPPAPDQPPQNQPYQKYKGTEQWRALNKAIQNLVKNKDLVENTTRDRILGYLCKTLKALTPKPSKAAKHRHIVAHSITLQDTKGNPRIYMDAGDEDGFATISLFGKNGRCILISSQPNGSLSIALVGNGANGVLSMSPENDAGLSLSDRRGRLGARLGPSMGTGEPSLELFKDGQLCLTLPKTGRMRKKKRAR